MTIEQVLMEVVKQIPALAVLAWLVHKGLSSLQERDQAFARALNEIGKDCHSVQERAIDAIQENTRMMGKVESLLAEVLRERDRSG